MTHSSKASKTETVPKLPFNKVKYRKQQLTQRERDKEIKEFAETIQRPFSRRERES